MVPIDRHFVILGMPRSGTTWLHRSLRRHSRMVCALRGIKEVHYFDFVHAAAMGDPESDAQGLPRNGDRRLARFETRVERIDAALPDADGARRERLETERRMLRMFIDDFGKSDLWYANLFEDQPGDWCLDCTPAYFRLPEEGLRHLLSVAETSRFVLLLRDPFDRTISGIQHRIALLGLEWDDWDETQRLAFCRSVAASGRAASEIARLRRIIPAELLHIAYFDDILAAPDTVISEVLDFAGLDCEPACLTENRTAPNPSPKLALSEEILTTVHAETRAAVDGFRLAGIEIPGHWDAPLASRAVVGS